jgi:hypothetical protein
LFNAPAFIQDAIKEISAEESLLPGGMTPLLTAE